MAEIIDPSQYFSPYHVSSQQHMVCSIGTHQERQIFGDQSKTMNDTNRSSFGFKFKNHETECNNNQQNHEGSRSEVHSQHIGFTPEQYHTTV